MVLRSRAHIHVGETECIGHNRTESDCAGGHAGYGIGLRKLFGDKTRQLDFHEVAHVGI